MSTVYLYMKHDDRASIEMDGIDVVGYLPFVNSVIGGMIPSSESTTRLEKSLGGPLSNLMATLLTRVVNQSAG